MRGCSFFLVHSSRPRPGKNGVVAARLPLKMPLEAGRFEILPLKRCRIQRKFILTKHEWDDGHLAVGPKSKLCL
jgi:hypothetical protein